LFPRGDEIDGAVAFGERERFEGGGDSDALGDGGGFCLWLTGLRGDLLGLLRESGRAKADGTETEEAEKAGGLP
jgi:hypothetical protein